MSKSVMISIRPQWCLKIAFGKRTPFVIPNSKKLIEMRKSKPKAQLPIKCFIYCTKNVGIKGCYPSGAYDWLGKVIGEFTCKKIDRITHIGYTNSPNSDLTIVDEKLFVHPISEEFLRQTHLTLKEIEKYSNGRDLYAWHISDLVIYDKPKDITEFGKTRSCNANCYDCKDCISDGNGAFCKFDEKVPLTRPPQSWCYVAED